MAAQLIDSVLDIGWRCWAEHVRVACKFSPTLGKHPDNGYYECSLLELVDNNYLCDEEIDEIELAITTGGEFRGGGGAQPIWTLCEARQ